MAVTAVNRYNQRMSIIIFLSIFFLLGLLFAGLILIARSPRARLILFALGLGLVNLSALAVLSAGFLAARLDGSRPPGLLEFLAGLWAPVGLLVLADAALLLAFFVKRTR